MSFFHFLSPTVPFILGRLGIPISGNKAIPSWLWHSTRNLFFSLSLLPSFLLRQKMIYLLVDSASLARSQAHWSKRGLGFTPWCSLSCWLILFPLHLSLNVCSLLIHFLYQPYLCSAFFNIYQWQPLPSYLFLMAPCYLSCSLENALMSRFSPQSPPLKNTLWQKRFTTPWQK